MLKVQDRAFRIKKLWQATQELNTLLKDFEEHP